MSMAIFNSYVSLPEGTDDDGDDDVPHIFSHDFLGFLENRSRKGVGFTSNSCTWSHHLNSPSLWEIADRGAGNVAFFIGEARPAGLL